MVTLFLTKEARIYNGAKTDSSINGPVKTGQLYIRMKLEHFLIPYTKINSKWIKNLNVRPETIKLLKENIGRTLNDINQSKILCVPPPRVMEIKTKVNKWAEKAMAPHSSTLAWKTPWMEEAGGLQSMGSLSWTRLSNFTFTFHFQALEKEMATHSSVLAWRIPGTGEPGGLPSLGSHRVGHD